MLWLRLRPGLRLGLGLWLCVAARVTHALGDDPLTGRNPMDILSVLRNIRPAKAVVNAVKLAAPDLFLNLEKRLQTLGYPFEEHTVRTEDGYLLTVHRIPHGRRVAGDGANPRDDAAGVTRPPIILQHGLFSCSEYWVLRGPGIAPGLSLVDSGYDVWMVNSRGNRFANKHEKMERRDPRFWKFSMDEMGLYDIPASIDYILNVTKQEKLYHMGHSMGNTIFFIAMSMRPKYNEKIRLHISLSPAVFFDDYKSAPFQTATANMEFFKAIVESLPTYEISVDTEYLIASSYFLCHEQAYFNKLCPVLLSMIVGPADLNSTNQLGLLLSRTGSGTSFLVLLHFGQILRSGKFIQLDHGEADNVLRYGAPRPSEYPLQKVTAPVAIFSAVGDIVVPVKAAEHLAKELPNVVSIKIIREKFFNHFEYINHPRLNELVTKPAINLMEQF